MGKIHSFAILAILCDGDFGFIGLNCVKIGFFFGGLIMVECTVFSDSITTRLCSIV